ncbi:monovalent cation/H(+) antiporter subunit G [Saccharomonospora saliphila]|uniref:monovalent cation/H(+) antiporter subunit G n=1 Tax=Saccharomonospora saliphila TaxID=369829 RepID=UPI000364765A|nr:monovalent cation/H(+) antiporter subunit G [Saccharomonospora saliphila]
MIVLDVLTAVLLLLGGLFCALGGLGVVRFPDLATRLQAATKPQTLGLLLILVGSALQLEPSNAAGILLAGLFQVITAPVLSQLFGGVAYHLGAVEEDTLLVDDLAERLDASRR